MVCRKEKSVGTCTRQGISTEQEDIGTDYPKIRKRSVCSGNKRKWKVRSAFSKMTEGRDDIVLVGKR